MTDWKKRVGGAVWILATMGLWFAACTSREVYSLPLFELALPAMISLVVGTFVPGAQEWLPWGRWWQRFQQRRVARGIQELEEEVDDEGERVQIDGAPYRGGVEVKLRAKRKRHDRRWAVALVVGGVLTTVMSLGVRGFLAHRDLAFVTFVSGIIATIVLSLSTMRDTGRAEAKAKLRIEEGVREMEAQHERVRIAEPEVVEVEDLERHGGAETHR